MYRLPSSRHKKRKAAKLNLVPILDAVFILIFFLLLSTRFASIFEIGTAAPVISEQEPDKKEKPLGLAIKIGEKKVDIFTGVPTQLQQSFSSSELTRLHDYLISLKQENLQEKTVIIEPTDEASYEKIIQVIDLVKLTDEEKKSLKLPELFPQVVFGNLQPEEES